ncbi:MAG: hypothetical protein R2792_19590 [Saprospiraceae bacterium]
MIFLQALNASVTTINFMDYNDQKISLLNKDSNFGNEGTASVAQDMEPEYIAFNAEGTMAYKQLSGK